MDAQAGKKCTGCLSFEPSANLEEPGKNVTRSFHEVKIMHGYLRFLPPANLEKYERNVTCSLHEVLLELFALSPHAMTANKEANHAMRHFV